MSDAEPDDGSEDAALEPPEVSGTARLSGASGPDRYLAALFDYLFAFLLALVAATVVGDERRDIWPGVAGVAAYVVYFLLGEGVFASTPGKAMFGLRVVTLDGRRCGFVRALVRTLARLIEFNPILLGGLPAAILITLTPRHQRLGDIAARTVVARTSHLND